MTYTITRVVTEYKSHCNLGLNKSPTTMQCVKERFEKSPTTLIRFAALLARLTGSLAAAAIM